MIQDVYGIKEFQVNLPKIARKISQVGGHYLVTNRSKPAMVAIPFSDYQEIEDILLELNSPLLKRDIKKGREEYRKNRTTNFRKFIKEAAQNNVYTSRDDFGMKCKASNVKPV